MPIEQICRRKTGEAREETRTTDRKKENNCKLGEFGRTSDFNIIIDGLDFNCLVRTFGARNFVLSVSLQE